MSGMWVRRVIGGISFESNTLDALGEVGGYAQYADILPRYKVSRVIKEKTAVKVAVKGERVCARMVLPLE